jgi:hypothetical protein
MEMLAEDIKQATTKKVPIDAIKAGYQYKKKLMVRAGVEEEANVTLVDLQPGKVYKAEIKTRLGINTTMYEIKDLGNGVIMVTAGEGYATEKEALMNKYKRMNFLVAGMVRRKLRKQLKSIEAHLKNRANEGL